MPEIQNTDHNIASETPAQNIAEVFAVKTPKYHFSANVMAVGVLILVVMLAIGSYFSIQTFGNDQVRSQLLSGQVSGLDTQISSLEKKVFNVSASEKSLSDQEVANRQVVEQKSQQDLLTAAVKKVSPSVVSIVISKEVPNLSVVYENPFGDDPMFQNSGIQVPVYQQNGSSLQEVGAGSGFIISSNGYILTNRHVVDDSSATYTVLTSDGTQHQASVVYVDPDNDIAVVKITGTYPAVTLGDSSTLVLGQSVAAIGNALGQYSNSVSVGVISGLNRTIQASDQATGSTETLTGVLQTDAAINPGNSGGPLLDLSGNVVGINVATVTGSNNVSFSIPINVVKSIIKQVL